MNWWEYSIQPYFKTLISFLICTNWQYLKKLPIYIIDDHKRISPTKPFYEKFGLLFYTKLLWVQCQQDIISSKCLLEGNKSYISEINKKGINCNQPPLKMEVHYTYLQVTFHHKEEFLSGSHKMYFNISTVIDHFFN